VAKISPAVVRTLHFVLVTKPSEAEYAEQDTGS